MTLVNKVVNSSDKKLRPMRQFFVKIKDEFHLSCEMLAHHQSFFHPSFPKEDFAILNIETQYLNRVNQGKFYKLHKLPM